jgi:hypothetical protein
MYTDGQNTVIKCKKRSIVGTIAKTTPRALHHLTGAWQSGDFFKPFLDLSWIRIPKAFTPSADTHVRKLQIPAIAKRRNLSGEGPADGRVYKNILV